MKSMLSPLQRCLRIATAALLSVAVLALALAPLAGSALGATGGAPAPGTATPAAKAAPKGRRAKTRSSAVATWFGPGFYGQQTACGQVLTPQTIGVAHRTLPCGTLVQVSYRGHSVTVPVIDRGPYSHIADWDLTYGAAQALAVTDTVRITTKIVGTAPNTPALGMPATPTTPSGGGAPPAPIAGGAVAR
jgi:rare lipoprotein A (peptidoglycan hydrolase)